MGPCASPFTFTACTVVSPSTDEQTEVWGWSQVVEPATTPSNSLGWMDSRTYILENREDERNKIVNVKALRGPSVRVDGVPCKKSGSLVGSDTGLGRGGGHEPGGRGSGSSLSTPPPPGLPSFPLVRPSVTLTSPLLGLPGVPAGEFLGTPCCVSGAADGPAGLDPGALGTVVFHPTPHCDPRCSRT